MSDRIDWKAAVWAGLIAGIVFMTLEMLLVATIGGGSPWGPPRMIGAMLLGPEVLPPPATFDLGVFLVAMVIHFILAIILAIPLAWAISRWRLSLAASIGAGAVFGLIIYLVNFYGFTALFPWFANARTPITLFAHLAFGVVLGWTYHALAVRHFAHEASEARQHPRE
ncbi:MAG TPA: hypothetical protein VMK31_06545 [Sphingomicrobium sp.]|nr:hypothetical protein [Sphingomicrobium sp.]